MSWRKNAEGAPAGTGRRRLAAVVVGVVVALAVVLGGGWAWTRWAHERALEDCRSAAAETARSIVDYRNDRTEAQRRLKTTPQGDVSGAGVLKALEKAARPEAPGIVMCDAGASRGALQASLRKAQDAGGRARDADAALRKASKRVSDDEARTLRARLDKAVSDDDALLSGSDGQVADNAVRDALKAALDQARAVQADRKADAGRLRKAIQDLAGQAQAVDASKAAKAKADQEAAEQQAQQAAAAASAPASGAAVRSGGSGYSGGGSGYAHGGSGYAHGGSGYARGGSGGGQAARRGGGGGGYTAPAPSSGGGGGGSSYAPASDHYTQAQLDEAHHYMCVVEPDITSGC